jgi:hypothetical protein
VVAGKGAELLFYKRNLGRGTKAQLYILVALISI